ncbi:MAG: hypothetical protein IJY53_02895 [Akkermansia sp.]|nr:hypothetical protein [Akkermansia sp.]
MNKKMTFNILAALFILAGAVWYFTFFPFTIGQPQGAVIRYLDAEQQCYQTVTLTQEQVTQLADSLKSTRPTVFYHEHAGMGNEWVLITLSYDNGQQKVYSLWQMGSTLFEGDAETLTMAAMLGDFPLHFGGSVDDSLTPLLRSLCPGLLTVDW